jgi:hypothetical protein
MTAFEAFHPADIAALRKLRFAVLEVILNSKALVLPCKFCIEIGVPEPPTPAKLRTSAWFIDIRVVPANPNSTFTSFNDICPEGVVII